MAEVDARPCQVKRVLCGNPTQPCWLPEDLAWNSSSTFGIAVIPPSPLVQGGLKGTCSGQWETPVTFASVHSFLLDQANVTGANGSVGRKARGCPQSILFSSLPPPLTPPLATPASSDPLFARPELDAGAWLVRRSS